MKHSHVQVNVLENQIECLNCGSSYKTSFKKPIDEYTQLLNAFVKDHKHCVKQKVKK